jgi:hypothetical protein
MEDVSLGVESVLPNKALLIIVERLKSCSSGVIMLDEDTSAVTLSIAIPVSNSEMANTMNNSGFIVFNHIVLLN